MSECDASISSSNSEEVDDYDDYNTEEEKLKCLNLPATATTSKEVTTVSMTIGSSDEENENTTAKNKTKKKHRKQKFRNEWLMLPEYKFWLLKVDDYTGKCSVCRQTLTAELSVLKTHSQTVKHKKFISGIMKYAFFKQYTYIIYHFFFFLKA